MKFLLVLVALPALGCASYTSMQTGRVLAEGQQRATGIAAVTAGNGVLDMSLRKGMGNQGEIGLSGGLSGTIILDLREQMIGDAKSPQAVALGLGTGFSYATWFMYAEATASIDLGGIEPYITYRRQFINANASRLDLRTGDADRNELFSDDDEPFHGGADWKGTPYEKLVDKEGHVHLRLNHFFLGFEIQFGRGWTLTPEISVISGEDVTILGGFGLGLAKKW